MHAHHGEAHGHAHPPLTARTLRLALVFTLAYIVLLVLAGVRAHSLALLSEAGHNASDFFALLLSWVAAYLGERPATSVKTYGWRRAGVLAAFVNALTLIVIAGVICYSAVLRFQHPEPVAAGTMMWVAAAGVLLNGAITLLLLRPGNATLPAAGARGKRDLNLRSVLIHEIGDTLATAAVIIGGWLISTTGQSWIDPLLSLAISALVLWSSIAVIRESLNILLEGAPSTVELEAIDTELRAVPGVLDVHDLHVWSIGSDTHALSSHITIADIPPSESTAILDELRRTLARNHHIHHTTIQFESADCDLAHGCIMPVPHEHHPPEPSHPGAATEPGKTT